MRNLLNSFLFLIFSASLVSCTKTTTIRMSEGSQKIFSHSQSFVLLPPIVEVNKIDIARKATRQYDYEYVIEEIAQQVLLEKLKEKGFNIRSASKKEIHDLKSSRYLSILTEDYITKISQLYTPLVMEEKLAFAIDAPLDNKVSNLSTALNSNFFVLVEYYVKSKTSGANAMDFAMSMFFGSNRNIEDLPEFSTLRLAIIDCNDSKIVWSNITTDGYGLWSATFGGSAEKVEKSRIKDLAATLLLPLNKNYIKPSKTL